MSIVRTVAGGELEVSCYAMPTGGVLIRAGELDLELTDPADVRALLAELHDAQVRAIILRGRRAQAAA
jgi:hypothetical protein